MVVKHQHTCIIHVLIPLNDIHVHRKHYLFECDICRKFHIRIDIIDVIKHIRIKQLVCSHMFQEEFVTIRDPKNMCTNQMWICSCAYACPCVRRYFRKLHDDMIHRWANTHTPPCITLTICSNQQQHTQSWCHLEVQLSWLNSCQHRRCYLRKMTRIETYAYMFILISHLIADNQAHMMIMTTDIHDNTHFCRHTHTCSTTYP